MLLLSAILISFLFCNAIALDPLIREFIVINTCGCSLILYSIDTENNARRLRKAEIANSTEVNSTGFVSDEFEVVAIANGTGNCTGHNNVTFQVNDNYGQGACRHACMNPRKRLLYIEISPSFVSHLY